MNPPLIFARITFFFICILLAITYSTAILPGHFNVENVAIGFLSGTLFSGILWACDLAIKNFNLRQFNLVTLGLFFGYLMGLIISTTLSQVFMLNTLMSFEKLAAITSGIFLFTCYLGVILTIRAAEEIHLSIPFVRFRPTHQKKKDILLDISILTDPRIIDLATSGLLDHHLIFPRFALKELYYLADNSDENIKAKARKSLDVIKKLESIPHLSLRYVDNDFPEIKDINAKLTYLARALDANIITADINRVQISDIEGIRVININFLSNALKPITTAGECLNIKIQRYGKEPRQGVGYLDDGTMVVVNGGAEFIGEVIRTQVLSVKHTSSGRMIFCNAAEDKILSEQELQQSMKNLENTHNNYYTL